MQKMQISLDDSQAKILLRLLAKQEVNPAEWRELIGLPEQIKEAVRVSDTLKTRELAKDARRKEIPIPPPLAPYWWLGGMTCHNFTSVAWKPEPDSRAYGIFILLKHSGHNENYNGICAYCETIYSLFDTRKLITRVDQAGYDRNDAVATWQGRWSKAKQAKMEKLCIFDD